MAKYGHKFCSNQHLSPLKVNPSECKHRTFSVSHISNRFLARLASLFSLPTWDLKVFGELPISYCEMLSVAPLFPSICYFHLWILYLPRWLISLTIYTLWHHIDHTLLFHVIISKYTLTPYTPKYYFLIMAMDIVFTTNLSRWALNIQRIHHV